MISRRALVAGLGASLVVPRGASAYVPAFLRGRAYVPPTIVNGVENVGWEGDLAPDVDDVPALANLIARHKQGIIRLVFVNVNSSNLYSAPCARALLDFCGLQSVPVGAYKGTVTPSASIMGEYAQPIATGFGQSGKTRADFPDALTIYKQVLPTLVDGSLKMVSTGFLTNMSAALADSVAGPLLRQKTRLSFIMGGDPPTYPSGEYNLAGDKTAAQYWFANWTGNTYTLGLTTGGLLTVTPSVGWDDTNPFKYAFSQFGVASRSAWDPATTLLCTDGLTLGLASGGFTVGRWGTNNVVDASTGGNTYSDAAGRNVGFVQVSGYSGDRALVNAKIDAAFASVVT